MLLAIINREETAMRIKTSLLCMVSGLGVLALSACQTTYQQQATLASAKLKTEQAQCNLRALPEDSSGKDWTSSSRPGDGSVFRFRGSRIGDPIEKMFPCHERSDLSPRGVNRCGNAVGVPGLRICQDFTGIPPGDRSAPMKIGPMITRNIAYHYLDGKLAGLHVVFWMPGHSNSALQALNWQKLSGLFEAKYGKPAQASTEIVQNQLGANFTMEVAAWETPHGRMTLRSRSQQLDEAVLDLQTPEETEAIKQRRMDSMKEQAKGAL